ncbi:unnamed protein product, partial [Vitis vinifera]
MQKPPPSVEFALKETKPQLGGGSVIGDKLTCAYDLVEQMHYLYVRVVKAKDLPPKDVTGSCDPYIEVKLGNYKGVTKHFEKKTNPVWNQVFAFSKDRLQASVLEVVVKDKDFVKDDFMGKVSFDLHEVPRRVPPDSPLAPQWYRLEDRKGEKAKGELMLAVWMGTQADEAFPDAWHSDAATVSIENITHIRSKVYLSPKLWYLRVNIIEAQDLVPSDKSRYPEVFVKGTLGNQALRTRTSQIKSINPIVASNKDEVLGKCVIALQNVQRRLDHKPINWRWYNLEKHYSSDFRPTAKPLWKPSIGILEVGILSAQGLAQMKTKDGRGTTDAYCVAKYGRKWLLSVRLGRAEPPLRKEVVGYMLDVDSHMWSMRRSKANFFRIMGVIGGLIAVGKWFNNICNWKNPLTTILIHILFVILVLFPELILPTILLYLFFIALWNFRRRPRHPPHMDIQLSHAHAAHPDELDEEFDTFPTSKPSDLVRMRYDRLRSIAGRIQTVAGDMATQGERFQSLLNWRDPRTTTLFAGACLIGAIVLYVTPFQVLALLAGFYILRHPRFRQKLPFTPLNFFRRLPSRADNVPHFNLIKSKFQVFCFPSTKQCLIFNN